MKLKEYYVSPIVLASFDQRLSDSPDVRYDYLCLVEKQQYDILYERIVKISQLLFAMLHTPNEMGICGKDWLAYRLRLKDIQELYELLIKQDEVLERRGVDVPK